MDSQRADGAGGQQVAQATRDLSPQVIAIMTTEHYNLQTGRAMTVSDTNGRASLFLGTVSTSLVALAFVGGLSRSARASVRHSTSSVSSCSPHLHSLAW
jgi:hypothetical protein